MKSYRLAILTVILIGTWFTGCQSAPPAAKESAPAKAAAAPKEPSLYTGQQAINRMMGLAVKWSPDAQPLRLESELTAEATGQGGKTTIWRGFFASPTRRTIKSIICSGSREPKAPPYGVSLDAGEVPYDANTAKLAFDLFLLKSDSDKAFEVAQEHGGKVILEKDAKQPITYVLLRDTKQNVPVWYVVYGKGDKDKKGIGIVNATTGGFVGAK